MNIAYVDIDSIFWRAFNNLRLFNLESFMTMLQGASNPDKILVYADFESKQYLKPVYTQLNKLKAKYPIEIMNCYVKSEKRNLTDLKMVNRFYQDFIMQEKLTQNNVTITMATLKYLPMVDFIEKMGANRVNLIVSNDIPYYEKLADNYNIVGTIDIAQEKANVYDKLIIREILKSIRWGQENNHWLTFRGVVQNCEKMSNIKPEQTEFMLHSMISSNYVEKRVAEQEGNTTKYIVLVLGEQSELQKLYSDMNIEPITSSETDQVQVQTQAEEKNDGSSSDNTTKKKRGRKKKSETEQQKKSEETAQTSPSTNETGEEKIETVEDVDIGIEDD